MGRAYPVCCVLCAVCCVLCAVTGLCAVCCVLCAVCCALRSNTTPSSSPSSRGFEDRPTFNAVGSLSTAGVPVTILNTSAAGTWLATSAYRVYLPASATAPQGPDHRVCAPEDHTDIDGGHTRLAKYANGTKAASPAACCALCLAEPDCVAWVAASTGNRSQQQGMNCWPFSQVGATKQTKAGRTFGYASPQSLVNGFVDATIVTPDGGRVLWQGSTPTPVAANELHWPSPLANSSYVSTDCSYQSCFRSVTMRGILAAAAAGSGGGGGGGGDGGGGAAAALVVTAAVTVTVVVF